MKIPRIFHVFGQKIRVKIAAISGRYAGYYDPSDNTITLSTEHDTDKELMHTLLHELGHVMFYRVSINQAVSQELHEYIVNNYATMLQENFWIIPKHKDNLKFLARSLDK